MYLNDINTKQYPSHRRLAAANHLFLNSNGNLLAFNTVNFPLNPFLLIKEKQKLNGLVTKKIRCLNFYIETHYNPSFEAISKQVPVILPPNSNKLSITLEPLIFENTLKDLIHKKISIENFIFISNEDLFRKGNLIPLSKLIKTFYKETHIIAQINLHTETLNKLQHQLTFIDEISFILSSNDTKTFKHQLKSCKTLLNNKTTLFEYSFLVGNSNTNLMTTQIKHIRKLFSNHPEIHYKIAIQKSLQTNYLNENYKQIHLSNLQYIPHPLQSTYDSSLNLIRQLTKLRSKVLIGATLHLVQNYLSILILTQSKDIEEEIIFIVKLFFDSLKKLSSKKQIQELLSSKYLEKKFTAQAIINNSILTLNHLLNYRIDLNFVLNSKLNVFEDSNFNNYFLENKTLLEFCISNNYIDILKNILSTSINLNKKNQHGQTALWNAVYHENANISKMLLTCGASPNTQDNNGISPLMLSCSRGDKDITSLLIEYGAKIDKKNNKGGTAFMAACRSGNLALVQLLIKAGANTSIANQKGRSALYWALKYRNRNVAKFLIKKNIRTRLNKRTSVLT